MNGVEQESASCRRSAVTPRPLYHHGSDTMSTLPAPSTRERSSPPLPLPSTLEIPSHEKFSVLSHQGGRKDPSEKLGSTGNTTDAVRSKNIALKSSKCTRPRMERKASNGHRAGATSTHGMNGLMLEKPTTKENPQQLQTEAARQRASIKNSSSFFSQELSMRACCG